MHGLERSGTPADLVMWFKFATFDMMGDLSIGKPFNCLKDGKYHTWVASLYESIKIGPYIRFMATYTDVKRLLPLLVPKNLREARARHERYIKENATERIKMGVMEERRDFLSYILPNRGEDGLTDDEVIANSSFLVLAGSDATSSALSGIFYHLLKNPAAMQKVTDEIRAAFATEDEIDFVTTGTRLSYAHAVVNEGFRMYPPGPTLAPRRTPLDGMTKIDDQWVPPWVSFACSRYFIPLLEAADHWNTPPRPQLECTHLRRQESSLNFHRAEEFIPERWLPEHANNSESPFFTDQRGASQPFGVGPRNCLRDVLLP